MPLYKIKIGEGSCGISAGAGKIHKLLDEKNSWKLYGSRGRLHRNVLP